MTALVATAVFAPLAAAIVAFASPRHGGVVAVSTSFVVAAASIGAALALPAAGAAPEAIGGWALPLGIRWRVDGLTVLMLVLASVVAASVGVYARGYFTSASPAERHFWPLFMLMLAGLNALFVSNDLFNLYVTLEILGLSAVALVTLAGTRTADRAAFRYLLVSLLGSLLYLAGVAVVYNAYAALDLLALGTLVRGDAATWVALAMMFTGLLLKSAVFPLHFWLPPAHSSAPAPVSALLSALVVKGSFCVAMRLWQDVVPGAPAGIAGVLLGLTGSAAILWGSVCALRTQRLKLLVAYSTVAQLGYLTLLFPLAGTPAAAAGVVYFIIAHGCAKAAMFMAAGNLQRAAGDDAMASIARIAPRLPMTMFAFALAGASIMGLPPSGGFIAKWTLLNAALSAGQWLWIVVIVAGGLLSAAYVFRVLVLAFQADAPAEEGLAGQAPTRAMRWAPLALAAVAVALGFNALPVLDTLAIGVPVPAGAAVALRP